MDQEPNPENRKPMERVLYEVKKVIVGQDHLLERLVVALLARGHVLVEGVPGLAKTMAIKTLAEAIGGECVWRTDEHSIGMAGGGGATGMAKSVGAGSIDNALVCNGSGPVRGGWRSDDWHLLRREHAV